MPRRAKLRFFLDQNVPDSVRTVFENRGYEVTLLRTVIPTDSPDPIVATTAQAHGAVLVTFDRDFESKRELSRLGLRYKNLSRILLKCREPEAASRLAAAMTLIASGDVNGGRARIADRAQRERQRLQSEPDNTDSLWKLGLAEAMLGNREEALRCAARVVELIPVSFDAVDGAIASNRLANVYAWAGETDRAIAEAARILQTPMVDTNVQYMRHDPWWFPLRGDPRFEALLSNPKNNAPLF